MMIFRSYIKRCLHKVRSSNYWAMLFIGIVGSLPSFAYAQLTDLPSEQLFYSDSLGNECTPNSPGDTWGWNGVCSCRVDQEVENFGEHAYFKDNLLIVNATQVPGSCDGSGSVSIYELNNSGTLEKVAELVASHREARDQFAWTPVAVSENYVAVGNNIADGSSAVGVVDSVSRPSFVTVFSRDNWQEVITIDTRSTDTLFIADSLVVEGRNSYVMEIYNTADWSLKQELPGGISDQLFNLESALDSGRFVAGGQIYEMNEQGLYESIFDIPPFTSTWYSDWVFDGTRLVESTSLSQGYLDYYRFIRTFHEDANGNWTEAPQLTDLDSTKNFRSNFTLIDGQLAILAYLKNEPETASFEFYTFGNDNGWMLYQSLPFSDLDRLTGGRDTQPEVIGSRLAFEHLMHSIPCEPDGCSELRSVVIEQDNQQLWTMQTYNPQFSYLPLEGYWDGRSAMQMSSYGPLFRTNTGNELLVPDLTSTSNQSLTGNCNYANADLYDGWGWNATTSESCAPLTSTDLETTTQCIDSDGDGFGWDGNATCIPTSGPVTSPTPDSNCDYTDADLYGGWGWNAIESQSCPPQESMSNIQPTALCIDTDGDGWGWDGTASCIP